jgi:hypothetical protein
MVRAGQATDDNIIRRKRIACWITKATNTLRMRNTPFPQPEQLRKRALYCSLWVGNFHAHNTVSIAHRAKESRLVIYGTGNANTPRSLDLLS